MDKSIEIVKKEEIKKIKGKQDFAFSLGVMILAIISLFPVFIFLLGLLENIFYLLFYIGLIILALDIILFPFEKYRGLFIEILVPIGIIGLVLVFTGIGGLAISRNPESDILLTFWYKGGVQFLITIILISGIIHLYLRKILLCNYHIKLINSYDETFFNKYLEKGVNMSKWVNKEEVSWLKLYHSTDEKRLVSVGSNGPLEVFPVSKKAYRAPWFRRDYDSFAFVNMEQKTLDIELENVTTNDRVRVEGYVSIQCKIKDDEKCIKTIVINEEEEESAFTKKILNIIQSTISEENWCDIVPVKERITKNVKQTLLKELSENDKEDGEPLYCFLFKGLTWSEIKPRDKELAESLEKQAKLIEDEKYKKEFARIRGEMAEIERSEKEREQEHIIQLQNKQQEADLTKERASMELEQYKSEIQIEIQEKKAKLLATKSGWLAAHPQETFKYLMKELDIQITDSVERQKLYREYLKATQYFRSGQINAINAWLERQHGFRIGEEPVPTITEEGQMLPTGKYKDEKKEGEEAKHENKKTGSDEKETKAVDEVDKQNNVIEEDRNKASKLNEEEAKPEENT